MPDPITSFFYQRLSQESSSLTDDRLTIERSLRDLVIEFFQQENWHYKITDRPEILRMVCQGTNSQWNCYAQIQEVPQQFSFYSVCPHLIPTAKRLAIAEYITRANYAMASGNFELDFTDGEIRYKTSIQLQGERLNLASIKHLVYTNIAMMDLYLPGILAVVEQDLEPSQAIEFTNQGKRTHLAV